MVVSDVHGELVETTEVVEAEAAALLGQNVA